MRYPSCAAALALAALLGGAAAAVSAGQLPVTAVEFTPEVQDKLRQYGAPEAAVLQAAILESVSRAAARTTLADGLTVTITVRDVAPTRPTRQQSADDPALDVMQTRYLGGAALVGEVRDARQQLVATVRHRYFSPAIRDAALSPDPWGDARLAIEQFTARLIKACRKLPH
ncbi:MAG: hypothetical protein ACHP9U_04040 [Steroidobacterales bacterium]|jgi:hypothetical protein